MKKLLESKDLLTEPRVVAVAKEMGLSVTGIGILCPQTVEGCVASVAFAMRDKSCYVNWYLALERILIQDQVTIMNGPEMWMMTATPEQWIRASVLAWKGIVR